MSKKELIELFGAPGAEWRAKPFWSWNGELEADELLRQVDVIKDMGWGGHFMHSRSGLITEYLGDEWFDLINKVTDKTEELGLESWLYDEDRWPSGSAGGKVTVDPQYRMKSLTLYETPAELYTPQEDDFSAFLGYVGEDGVSLWYYAPIKTVQQIFELQAAHPQVKPGAWKVLRFCIVPDACSSGYNGTTYIDTMSEKATRRFIELTHEEYKKRCGDRLGRSIKGIFTDEPHRGHGMDNLKELENGVRSCQIAWTDDLFEEFEKRYGYDARPLLPALFYFVQGKRVAPVKLHYFDLADNLFLERFADPLNDWCNENGILFTGHVLHEDSLSNQTVPQGSLMRFYEHMGLPGVDVLTEGNRDYWVVKQLASTARQIGKPWLLSELYGCTGWQFDFRGHKAVGDWQALFGINLRCPHLSWYTMEGQSKRDYPASMLHQSAWYKDYPLVEDYFARFGVLMQAQPVCDVLVLNPIESVWCQTHLGWAKWIMNADPVIETLERAYVKMFHALTDHHLDFDYGEEDIMARRGSVEQDAQGNPVLRVGKMIYHTVVVGGMLTMRPSTLKLLTEFADVGGSVIFAGSVPTYVDAHESSAPALLAGRCTRVPFEAEELAAAVRKNSGCAAEITGPEGCAQDVFVQVRFHQDAGVYTAVVLNTDRENAKQGLSLTLTAPGAAHAEEWDLVTGRRYDADGTLTAQADGSLSVRFSLEAAGTRAFVFTAQKEALPVRESLTETREAQPLPQGEYAYTLEEENVCVLDFARWRWAQSEWHESAEALKADQHIRDELGIERRGGEMLQPWYSKLHHSEVYGTLELEYTFDIETLPQGPVTLAAERPETMHYAVNGTPLQAQDAFWVDICFKRLPIPAGVLKTGRNTVTVTTQFTRNTNVEALYLLGNFGVRTQGHAGTLTALPATLHFGSLADQGLPFYTGCLTYHLPGELWAATRAALQPGDSVWLQPGRLNGALVRVTTPQGTTRLGWEPLEADITEAVRDGAEVQLTLVGTRRNTFGPLHLNPAYDVAYGPDHFVSEGEHWSDDYIFIESGIESAAVTVRSAQPVL